MKKITSLFLMLNSGKILANRYGEYSSNPKILEGASGSDDTALVVTVTAIFIGSFIVAEFFKREYYTPFKEVIIYIIICVLIGYFWMMNN